MRRKAPLPEHAGLEPAGRVRSLFLGVAGRRRLNGFGRRIRCFLLGGRLKAGQQKEPVSLHRRQVQRPTKQFQPLAGGEVSAPF